MRPTALCLLLLALSGTGCINLTGEWLKPDAARARGAEVAEPPPPVKPEEVNEAGARDVLKRLEDEIRFDEQSPRPGAARTP